MASRRRAPEAFLRRLWALDDQLVQHGGWKPIPGNWWRETINRFEHAGKRRRIIRKGRRVFASTRIAPLMAVAEMLWGQHEHIHGSPPLVYAFISVKRGEASNRLRGVKAILEFLGEPYHQVDDTIELVNRPAIFAVMTASAKLSVGETVAWCWCDEVSRWNDTDGNPAKDVVSSVAPSMATLPNASLWMVSSPMGHEDFHAVQYDRGETADQSVAFGETWTINPTLTKEETKLLEPDHKVWLREYAAVPQGSDTAAFDPETIDFAFREWPRGYFAAHPIVPTDFSSGRGDATVWADAGWKRGFFAEPIDFTVPLLDTEGRVVDGMFEMNPDKPGEVLRDGDGRPLFKPGMDYLTRPQLCIGRFDVIEGKFFGVIPLDDIVARIARRAHHIGAARVVGDQREDAGLEVLFRQNSARFESTAVTQQNKQRAVTRLRRLLADRQVAIQAGEDAENLRRELKRYREIITSNGNIRYTGKRTGGDDRVACLVNCLIAEDEGWMPGSPIKSGSGVRMSQMDNRL